MHPNEIDFRTLTEDEALVWDVLALNLGKPYVNALAEQRKRQANL
jgi:hypothetical protein